MAVEIGGVWIYVLRASTGESYVGLSNAIVRRVSRHFRAKNPVSFLRGKYPIELEHVWWIGGATRAQGYSLEAALSVGNYRGNEELLTTEQVRKIAEGLDVRPISVRAVMDAVAAFDARECRSADLDRAFR